MAEQVPFFDPTSDQQKEFNGFAPAPIPDPRDKPLDAFLATVIAGGQPEVQSRLATLSDGGRRVVRSHAERLASRAVRDRKPDLLVQALVAAVLGGLDQNAWEALMPMALIDDAATRLGVDHSDLFEQAAGIVGHPGSVNLMVWLSRPAEDRTPKSMGFEPSEEAGGFRYAWS